MKKVCCTIGIVLVLLMVIGLSFLKLFYCNNDILKTNTFNTTNKISKEFSYYNRYVKTNNESILYDLEFKEIGKINKDIQLELDGFDVYNYTIYFKIKNIDYYIKYDSVVKIEKLNNNDRYKRYVVFNQNVVTKDKTVFYNDDGYSYEIYKGIDLPLIINEDDKYYVEYNNNLFYIKKEDSSLKDNNNTNEDTRTNIRTFTYHAVYKEGDKCTNESICHPYKQFDEQMKYLSDNNYLTLTMEELEMFLDRKINIPIKTVVITLDDGNLAKNAIEILEKYKLHATYFIITEDYKDKFPLKSDYVQFESHTDSLHNNYKCPGGEQGGQLLCEDEDVVLKDLKTSQEKLGGSHYFSYPYFDWNERAFRLLKEAGFRLAFIGQWTDEGYSTFDTNRMMMRRKTIFADDSLDTFISYLK